MSAKKSTTRKVSPAPTASLLATRKLAPLVRIIRHEKVLLDSDLAELYGVETKVLNQAVKRNLDRFPEDFMFQLIEVEADSLRSQIVTLNAEDPNLMSQSVTSNRKKTALRSQTVILKRGQHLKYLPYAFTEQGVAMLSSVLRSPRAVEVNIAIMRTFVQRGPHAPPRADSGALAGIVARTSRLRGTLQQNPEQPRVSSRRAARAQPGARGGACAPRFFHHFLANPSPHPPQGDSNSLLHLSP